MTTGTLQTYSG